MVLFTGPLVLGSTKRSVRARSLFGLLFNHGRLYRGLWLNQRRLLFNDQAQMSSPKFDVGAWGGTMVSFPKNHANTKKLNAKLSSNKKKY